MGTVSDLFVEALTQAMATMCEPLAARIAALEVERAGALKRIANVESELSLLQDAVEKTQAKPARGQRRSAARPR
jgi:hypothetical protein